MLAITIYAFSAVAGILILKRLWMPKTPFFSLRLMPVDNHPYRALVEPVNTLEEEKIPLAEVMRNVSESVFSDLSEARWLEVKEDIERKAAVGGREVHHFMLECQDENIRQKLGEYLKSKLENEDFEVNELFSKNNRLNALFIRW